MPGAGSSNLYKDKVSNNGKNKRRNQEKKPSEIDTNTGGSIFKGSCNRKQIYNIKARTKPGGQALPKANFADQVAALEELQHTLPFLQLIVRQSRRVPIIILYTEDQINDLKRFCCPPHAAQSTMLGIDKNFNLSDLHVTGTVYKSLSVKRRDTGAHPIFCGPLILHGKSDIDTFYLFLQHLSGKPLNCPQLPVLGSDGEMALRQAMALAFPHTPRLVCTRHLKKKQLFKCTCRQSRTSKTRKKDDSRQGFWRTWHHYKSF